MFKVFPRCQDWKQNAPCQEEKKGKNTKDERISMFTPITAHLVERLQISVLQVFSLPSGILEKRRWFIETNVFLQ